ncbi:phage tail tape measure protein [Methylomonas sp. 11b]|uniref:phage tail tape measure protein n=1 Tax=Methylomonas sp. 11b TaxID=1168169 RepID=UPI00047C5BDA|nr:hypothetical protein [Methylomonas sp. 11b]
MKEIKTGLRIDMHGNILAQSQRYADAINKFSQKGRRDMKALGDSANRVGGNFDRMGSRMAGLATGAVAVGLVKQVGEMERRMTRLGIAADQSDATIKALKDDIYAAATAPDIRIDPSQIITAIEQVLEMTGDFEFSKAQIRNIGIALQATGADASAVGGMFAEFEKAGIKSPAAVAEAIGTLAKQGKEGAFTLAEFARMGPRLYSAYAAVGRSGQIASREIGAVAQVVRGATGSSEQATTSIEALLRVFSDTKKIEKLNKAGIKVFDVAELKKGHQVLRPLNQLMADIVKKTKGRATIIQDLLGDSESTRAFGNLIKEYNLTGDTKSLEHFIQLTDDGTTALKDSQRAANDSAAAMTELYSVLQKFADDSLTAPIHFIADELKSLMNDYREFKTLAGQTIDAVMAPRSNRGTSVKPGPLVADVAVDMAGGDTKPAAPLPRGRGGYSVNSAPAVQYPSRGSKPAAPIGIQNLGRDPQAATPAGKPADGKLVVEIQGAPVKVKSLQANSGQIDVKNTRAGAHFQ